MKLSKIIKRYRIEKKLSMREFAKKSNVSNAYISLIESEDTKSPTLEMISKLASGMNMQTNDLINLMNDEEVIKIKSKGIFNKDKQTPRTVPVYTHISADTSFDAIQSELGNICVPDKIAKKKELFGLKISDNSMNRVIPDGAIGVFQRSDKAKPKEVVAVIVGRDNAIIRHLHVLQNGYMLEPDSYSDEHMPRIIKNSDGIEVRVIGKLVWYCVDIAD